MEVRKEQRWWMGMLALVAGVAGPVWAVEFDQKLSAPMSVSAGDVTARASAISSRLAGIREASPLELVTDRALSREQFDLGWQLQLVSDERRPVADLAAIGVEDRGNGELRIDTSAHPESLRLAASITTELPRVDWETFGPYLTARGFHADDVARLREYVTANNVRAATLKPLVPISASFRKLVLAYDKMKKPVPDALVMSYLYQRAVAHADAEQRWTAGALAALDAQSARVLVSHFRDRQTFTTYSPDDRAAGIAAVLSDLRRPDYDSIVTRQIEERTR